MKKICLLLIFAFSLGAANASVFNGEIRSFTQPDGSSVDVKLYGTEYYMRGEGLDGYTLIRDAATQWLCYARLSADKNELISTGIMYKGKQNNPGSLKNDLPFALHLDISAEARKLIIKKNKLLLGAVKKKPAYP